MYIKKTKIGNIEIKNNIFLAPMAGWTDRAFRKICADFGAGLVYTEMVSAKGIIYNDVGTMELLKCDIPDMPRAVQIFGNEPAVISEAIKKIEEYADIIDINMGCPVPKIVSNGEGSALLQKPQLVYDIVKSAVDVTDKPITVKIRKGFNEENINAVEISKLIEKAGASLITIHGRTRSEFYTGKCDNEIIKQVKENVYIPVIGNGDIVDYMSMIQMAENTKVDGFMIGRESLGKPWIFDDILKQNNNEKILNRTTKEIFDIIKMQYMLEKEYKGERIAVKEMRKHIGWYLKGLPNNIEVKNAINVMEDFNEIIELLEKFLCSKS